MGCNLEIIENGLDFVVSGNTCKRGELYGIQEMKSPMRIVTSLVKTETGRPVSVKTSNVVPKSKIFDVLNALKESKACSDSKIGDVIVENILGLGVDIVVTGECQK